MERAFEEKGVFEEKVGGLRGEGQGYPRIRPWDFEEKVGGLRGEGWGSSPYSKEGESVGFILYESSSSPFIQMIHQGCPRLLMYGACLPHGKCSRLQRRLQAALKVTSCYKGWLHAIVKAATELDVCYEGCHIGYCEGYNTAKKEVVVEVMAEIIGRDASTCKLQTRRGTSEMERAFEEKGVFEEKVGGLRGEGRRTSRRRPGVFEEKVVGLRGVG
ncbi:hypothetical protein Tco_0451445 [Tanacetum coccineum]